MSNDHVEKLTVWDQVIDGHLDENASNKSEVAQWCVEATYDPPDGTPANEVDKEYQEALDHIEYWLSKS